MHCSRPTMLPWKCCLIWAVLGAALLGAADMGFAQEAPLAGESASDVIDPDEVSSSKVYTSPQSILADFFGRRRAGMVVHGIEDMVGIAATGISPMFVLSVVSPTVYFLSEPDQRSELIFLYQPWFFIPIILVTLMVAFKDTVLSFASYLKMPLDILGILFNVIGFFLGFRLIYHFLDIPIGSEAGVGGSLLAIGILILMFAFYISVWVLSNVFEVLILINPFPLIDTMLRVGRIGILLLMYAACWIHPALGGMIALPILIISLIMFERSLRTTLLGFRLVWDVALFRKEKIASGQTTFTVFSSVGGSLPWMTLGKAVQTDQGLSFHYRRFSIGPTHCIELPSGPYAIGRGSLFPGLLKETDSGSQLIVRFPASFRGQEDVLAERFGSEDVHDFRLSTMARSAWKNSWQFLFGRREKDADPAEAQDSGDPCSEDAHAESLAVDPPEPVSQPDQG
ncbi:hypothetical protein [Blastopirellula marina]|nr:hypothetical protein [Blastopirellula marina]